jgi:hypothetical protein
VSATAAGLPQGFEDLAPFAEEWAGVETAEARYARRQSLPMARLSAYYAAVQPRLGAIFAHLDSFAFDRPLPAAEARLFNLVMGMSEVAQAVEVFGQPGVPHAPPGHSVAVRVLTRA